jgi:CarD family transcriptional regulator, regulator of rRNA transcription
VVEVEDVLDLEVDGTRRTHVRVRPVNGNLTITVPLENVEMVGIRLIACREDAEAAFELLSLDEDEAPTLWTQRFKANLTKLASGDINLGAEIVRDLALREKRAGISSSERTMLAKARQILITELSFSFDATEESAQTMLDGALDRST